MSGPLPKRLGRYEIQEEIGRGMMGVVYRALDPALGRTVALKTVQLAFAVPEEERACFEQRFLTEARVAAGLSHPGIVVVHDVGRDPATRDALHRPRVPRGRDARRACADGAVTGGRPCASRRAWPRPSTTPTPPASSTATSSPPTSWSCPSGEPKLMDFGIAKVPASQLTTAGEFFGTPVLHVAGAGRGRAARRAQRPLLPGLRAVPAAHRTARVRRATVPAILARVDEPGPAAALAGAPGLPRGRRLPRGRALAKDPDDRYADGRTWPRTSSDVRDGRAAAPPRRVDAAPAVTAPLRRAECRPGARERRPASRSERRSVTQPRSDERAWPRGRRARRRRRRGAPPGTALLVLAARPAVPARHRRSGAGADRGTGASRCRSPPGPPCSPASRAAGRTSRSPSSTRSGAGRCGSGWTTSWCSRSRSRAG